MPLLALDTSAAHCAVALLSGGDVVAEVSEPMSRGQAERLLPLAEDVLGSVGMGWTGLTALAVGIGPGNFTGIRIAVSAVRGLALGLDIPAIGVTSFEAHAEGRARPLLVALDARRERVYVQGFGTGPEAPRMIARGALAPAPGTTVATDAPALLAGLDCPLDPLGLPSAAAIARIAAQRAHVPQPAPAPLYLRPADAAPPREAPPVILDDA